jgi:DNA mismatch repair protein MutS2
MRLKISWDQLDPKAKPAIVPGRSQYRPQEEVDCPAEINLIGKTVDQAMDDVQSYLDRASRSGRASVRIVHGHGSGALRKAIRDFLAKSDYEMKFRTGTKQEGGEGCTVIEFI